MRMVCDGHVGGFVAGGDPATWCPALWRWLVERLGVQSVLDVGCGEGHAVQWFAALGCHADGIDGSPAAVAHSAAPGHVFFHDLCLGPYVPERSYDMIWSCEFLEHVEEKYLAHVLETLAAAERYIVLTHAFPGQKGHHHVNCQPSAYWIALIEKLGFACMPGLTLQARRVTRSDYCGVNHFARSGLVFQRRVRRRALGREDWLRGADVAAAGRRPNWRARLLSTMFKGNFKLAKMRHKVVKRLRAAN